MAQMARLMAARAIPLLVALGGAVPAAAQTTAPGQPLPDRAAPPSRIGPEWNSQNHQPNPAEIEARSRAQGLPTDTPRRQAADVDTLYRNLTGSDPNAPPRSTQSRDADRR